MRDPERSLRCGERPGRRAAVLGEGAVENRQQDARQRREAYYSGRVQGVGFRFAVRQLAEMHPVVGFVRNLADGRVHLVAEGEPAALDAFLAAVAERMSGYIRHAAVESRPGAGGLVGFEIRTSA